MCVFIGNILVDFIIIKNGYSTVGKVGHNGPPKIDASLWISFYISINIKT